MAMNASKFKSIWNGLTIVAQKVYTAVPMQGAWTAHQIHAELGRLQTARDMHTTAGCLNSLVRSGVVLESQRGYFTRAPIRGAVGKLEPAKELSEETPQEAAQSNVAQTQTETVKEPEMAAPSVLAIKPAVKDPIDRLTELSGRVMSLSGSLKQLANDIDQAALDITEQMNVVDADTKKLKQLQAMLKELV